MINTSILQMHKLGNNLSIDVEFWNKNTREYDYGLFTIDTGASVTTISTDILFDLGYNVIDGKPNQISTASSIEFVREVVVDKIRIGDFVLENVLVYAHTFPESCFTTGVIGLNILSQFDINLIFSKKLIEINKQGLTD